MSERHQPGQQRQEQGGGPPDHHRGNKIGRIGDTLRVDQHDQTGIQDTQPGEREDRQRIQAQESGQDCEVADVLTGYPDES